MEIKKYEQVTQTQEVVQEIVCDGCKKSLDNKKLSYKERKGPTTFYHVVTMHSDWGNDSVESYKEFDFCPACLKEKFEEYWYKTTHNIGTNEFQIEQHKGWGPPLDKSSF